jgi:hypothetical protein
MSEMLPERVAAIEQLAMDLWQMIASRTRNVDDVVVTLSMLVTQMIMNMPDPQRAAEPMLRQVNEFVRTTLEENRTEPRSH